jgi:hypothetical protein
VGFRYAFPYRSQPPLHDFFLAPLPFVARRAMASETAMVRRSAPSPSAPSLSLRPLRFSLDSRASAARRSPPPRSCRSVASSSSSPWPLPASSVFLGIPARFLARFSGRCHGAKHSYREGSLVVPDEAGGIAATVAIFCLTLAGIHERRF